MKNKGENVAIRTVCVSGDGFGCGLLMQVKDGTITKVEPADFPNPDDRGACARGLAIAELVHHQDREKAGGNVYPGMRPWIALRVSSRRLPRDMVQLQSYGEHQDGRACRWEATPD